MDLYSTFIKLKGPMKSLAMSAHTLISPYPYFTMPLLVCLKLL